MTSPVDFISGPRIGVDTLGKRLNGNTASLTATCVADRAGFPGRTRTSLAPAMTRAPILATATPVAFATNGTVREARGIDLQDEDLAVLDGVLHVHQPDHMECAGQGRGLLTQFGD